MKRLAAPLVYPLGQVRRLPATFHLTVVIPAKAGTQWRPGSPLSRG